uniref:NADH-ubiquinone oxidoreductase chain 6 n=1 Tax=Prosopocoilus confucius TaxID=618424 RepID=A0A342LJ65_9SCAR|nr:NADH dehydrogenase subunit 6 [Prosopocoilus confucius]ANY60166.1 NADH dehydrogenase subunit 6 [Prosopocoilus confucius]
MTTMFLYSILNSLMLPLLNHPLSLGLLLLIQTIIIAMISGSMNITFWYSYIMMLIMIGGMLVLFMYMTNVASNEKFKFSMFLSILLPPSIILSLLAPPLMDQWFMNSKTQINEATQTINPLSSLNKFLNFPAITLSTTLIIYLLITMIIIIKIIDIKHGPLRHHN